MFCPEDDPEFAVHRGPRVAGRGAFPRVQKRRERPQSPPGSKAQHRAAASGPHERFSSSDSFLAR